MCGTPDAIPFLTENCQAQQPAQVEPPGCPLRASGFAAHLEHSGKGRVCGNQVRPAACTAGCRLGEVVKQELGGPWPCNTGMAWACESVDGAVATWVASEQNEVCVVPKTWQHIACKHARSMRGAACSRCHPQPESIWVQAVMADGQGGSPTTSFATSSDGGAGGGGGGAGKGCSAAEPWRANAACGRRAAGGLGTKCCLETDVAGMDVSQGRRLPGSIACSGRPCHSDGLSVFGLRHNLLQEVRTPLPRPQTRGWSPPGPALRRRYEMAAADLRQTGTWAGLFAGGSGACHAHFRIIRGIDMTE